jgi:hypothetical protein
MRLETPSMIARRWQIAQTFAETAVRSRRTQSLKLLADELVVFGVCSDPEPLNATINVMTKNTLVLSDSR